MAIGVREREKERTRNIKSTDRQAKRRDEKPNRKPAAKRKEGAKRDIDCFTENTLSVAVGRD
jgi:hypothetical protein